MSKAVMHGVGGYEAGYGRPAVGEEVARFGTFELDLRRRELRRRGVKVTLQQQPPALLALLVAHRGDIDSRECIEETIWQDGRFVDFERGINTAIRKLRRVLGENANESEYIETVPREGYRLKMPVTSGAGQKPAAGAIAVLPLRDLSGTPDPHRFVEGLTDALITEMVRSTRLRVVSQWTTARYQDSRQSLPEIARELNVQAIVEGSIQRSKNHIRITARLLDAAEDRHLWAQTYDRNLQDVLGLNQEIAGAIASCAARALGENAGLRTSGQAAVLDSFETSIASTSMVFPSGVFHLG